ncbi:MAG TPA: FprA family A-type flavoprotein, partial [Stenomitos sp.]
MHASSATPSLALGCSRDVQVAEIGADTRVLRSRTWERLKFEAEYARQKGTTANSYLICGDQTLLIDPPGESFTQVFLEALQEHLGDTRIDYILLSHVNANRMATLKVLVEQMPQVQILCSKPAANMLRTSFPRWSAQIRTVRVEETLDLGRGHRLQFIFAPTPSWPDELCTYDSATQILFCDKFLGVHVCDDLTFDENWRQLDADRRHYFDCLHAAQSKQVGVALEKFLAFEIQSYAPAHGPVVRYSSSRFSYDYRQWCQQQEQQELRVALLYASAYGNTATLANAIAQGLIQEDIAVEAINCELADPADITRSVEACDGFIVG